MKRNVTKHAVVQPLDNSIRIIPLTHGQFAKVDALVWDCICQCDWIAISPKNNGTYIAVRSVQVNGKSRYIKMHREIVGDAINVDHENGDSLDNKGTNLRPATTKENSRNRKKPKDNTSGYKGVWWRGDRNCWVVSIRVDGRQIYLGSGQSPKELARLYDRAAIDYFGEFARTNFPRFNYE